MKSEGREVASDVSSDKGTKHTGSKAGGGYNPKYTRQREPRRNGGGGQGGYRSTHRAPQMNHSSGGEDSTTTPYKQQKTRWSTTAGKKPVRGEEERGGRGEDGQLCA